MSESISSMNFISSALLHVECKKSKVILIPITDYQRELSPKNLKSKDIIHSRVTSVVQT